MAGGQSLLITDVEHLDATDASWLAGLIRRTDPAVLQVILMAGTGPVAEPMATVVEAYAERRELPERDPLAASRSPETLAGDVAAAARRYVSGHCLSTDQRLRSAYASLTAHERASLHDAEAERLGRSGLPWVRRGAIPFHLEQGSDASVAVVALSEAMGEALMAGFYDQVVGLGQRVRDLVSWADDEQTRWLATVKMTIAYQAMGMPDEAMELFDDACAGSSLPSVHMQSAYGRAMVYTRYYDEARRDLRKAKGLINTAVALAGLSSDEQRRAFNRTFNENGLALIDLHLGNIEEAVELIEGGIARLDREVEGGRYLLHRSVLRCNHAQLMVRQGRIEQEIEEYTQVIGEDPHHPDYWFERAALFERLGRRDAAIADYSEAIRVGPPYPEPIYNRGELRMRSGDAAGALKDFDRVLELEPTFVDAYVNRASLLLESGNVGDAARDVAEGLRLSPEQPHRLCLRGALALDDGDLDEARAALERAFSVDPAMSAAWANLGAVLFELGELERCIDCLERSITLHDDPDVRENLELARTVA